MRRGTVKIDPLDRLFADYVKLKAGGMCEYCGQTPKSQGYHCHHGVAGRRYLNTRWEEDNCVALCLACHNLFSDIPGINQGFFLKRIGSKRMEEIEVIARTYKKMTQARRDEIKAEFQERIKLLEEK